MSQASTVPQVPDAGRIRPLPSPKAISRPDRGRPRPAWDRRPACARAWWGMGVVGRHGVGRYPVGWRLRPSGSDRSLAAAIHGPAPRIQHRESRLRRGAADARDARAGPGRARDLVAARGRRGEAELVDVAAAQDGAQALVLGHAVQRRGRAGWRSPAPRPPGWRPGCGPGPAAGRRRCRWRTAPRRAQANATCGSGHSSARRVAASRCGSAGYWPSSRR